MRRRRGGRAGVPYGQGVAPVRFTRRGRVVLAVIIAVIALGVFWLGTRAAGLASSWDDAGAGRPPGPTLVAVQEGGVR